MFSNKWDTQHSLVSIDIRTSFTAELEPMPAAVKISPFDAERITTQFYLRFQQEHAIFQNAITGIASPIDRAQFASLLLNRLMFLYFIQKKGLLDGNINYLPDK